jgi:hypothetical protein
MKKKITIPDFVSKEDKERLLKNFPNEFMKAINWDVVDRITDKEEDNE